MSSSAALVPPQEWRSLFRALLRESTYLPDPIAKGFMHDHTRQRFHRYAHDTSLSTDITRQHQLRKTAKQRLTLLRRANEGYTKPLEQVLRLSYGRTGKRRRDLVTRFITPEVQTPPRTNEDVTALLQTPSLQDEHWTPPQLVLDLLKSQQRNGVLHELSVRPLVKTLEPPIPSENAWGKPVSIRRRNNIRQRWYSAVLGSLFPPLPGEELDILRGLIGGSVSWTPPKRRQKVQRQPTEAKREDRTCLSPGFLVEGPAKGHTFRQYVNGRPHNITRRFMRRLWQRVVCLVPLISWNETAQKYHVAWEPIKPLAPLAVTMSAELASDLFASTTVETPTPGPKPPPRA